MSYTPEGLFNHTAAIYQMLTGYPPDKVSPSGQLEPPSPRDFPTAGSQISKLKPPDVSMLPFVEMPRPLQESNVIGKGGAAGFLGKAYDPYRLYQDPNKPIKIDDLALRSDVGEGRLKGRFELLKGINSSMKDLEKAVSSTAVDEYYAKAYDLVLSGKARSAFEPRAGACCRSGEIRPHDVWPGSPAGPAVGGGGNATGAAELACGCQRQSRSRRF